MTDALRKLHLAALSDEFKQLSEAVRDPAAPVDFRRLAFVRRVLAASLAPVLGVPARLGS